MCAAHRKNPPKDAAKTIERLAAEGHSIIGIAKNLGVSRETFKRWCEESQAIQEAFEIGRETERQALHALIVQSAVLNKPANVNAFFILKARHGYREADASSTKVDVAVAVAPVMIVRDYGTKSEWEAALQANQRALTAECSSPALSAPPQAAQAGPVAALTPPSYLPPAYASEAAPVPSQGPRAPVYDAPVWRAKA